MPAGWAAAAAGIAGAATSYVNNQNSISAANKNNAEASNVATGQNTALSTAEAINNTPFTPYTAPLVAGLSGNQTEATGLAASEPGGPAGQDFSAAGSQIAGVAGNGWNSQTAAQYMNPYVSDVVNNSIENANQNYLQTKAADDTTSGASGAFGGSAQALSDSELGSQNQLNIGNITANGYSNAYNNAVNTWTQDNERALNAASAFQQNGNDIQKMNSQQIQDLMETGGAQQAVSQNILSSNYGQFLRQQGWSANELQPLLNTLSSIKGANTGQSAPPANNGLNQILGAGATVAGLYGNSLGGNGGSGGGSSSDPYANMEDAPAGYSWGSNGGIVPISSSGATAPTGYEGP